MARPTNTRAGLRQAIAKELQMRFARRWPVGKTGAASTGPIVLDTQLTQEIGYWKNAWLFVPGTGDQALITSFVSSDGFTLEYTPGTAIASTDTYELLDVWNASEIHDAINRAIQEAFPAFFDIVTDETLVVQEDKIQYDLSSLTTAPFQIDNVYIEQSATIMRGTAAGGVATYLTTATGTVLTGVDTILEDQHLCR